MMPETRDDWASFANLVGFDTKLGLRKVELTNGASYPKVP